ncbi:MAG: alkaline phosphatase family protein, partial [Gaiellaceae bacterium]
MRVLCLGLDGADYDLVRELLAQGRLPTLGRLSREGTFGPLRSTIPAFTPTAWSSFLTGLNPAGHGIFAFTSNPNRGGGRLESAASRAGAPLWRYLGAAGIRSAFVTVPFTHPAEQLSGILVTGFGGPRHPEIVPLAARNAILTSHPDLRVSRHPSDLQDFAAATATLSGHVEEIADVCLLSLELEPDLGLLCVDFMSSDIAGHLMWHRLDRAHPAHRAGEAGDELVQVYEAVDAACGRLIEQAEWLWDKPPTVFVLSDHGMKPTHWLFRANRWLEDAGYLRFREGAATGTASEPAAYAPELEDGLVDEQPPWAEIDFGETRAYCFGYGGQIYLGEVSGAEGDRGLADELAAALAEVSHPESGEPAFDVRRKEELYRGFYLDRAPELVLLPRDERIHVDSTRQRWSETFHRHEHLFARGAAHFS